jgi:DnaK suppressor protein
LPICVARLPSSSLPLYCVGILIEARQAIGTRWQKIRSLGLKKTPAGPINAPSRQPPELQMAKKKAAEKSSMLLRSFEPYKEKRGEEYMNEKQREHFKKLLLEWKRDLMTEVDRTVNHMKDDAANFPDPADRATQEEEFSLELRTRDRERKLIKKIDKTVEMIDANDYGYCEQCGVEIGIRRLEARPTATLCVDCKTLDEIRERQTVGS